MADKAHEKTDKMLESMEKRLSAIYKRAGKEIQQTADGYFKKFAKADKIKREQLEKGEITEEEYKHWQQSKVAYGKRYKEMQRQVTEQLYHVNQTATAYINGELPEVYALNYNSLAETVDGIGGYSFTLTDADTIRNLAITDDSLLPYREINEEKDVRWNMKKINSEVLQGIIQGENVDKIAKRIGKVQKMNKEASIRSARTIVTGAENKGRQDSYLRAEKDGIQMKREWIATSDARTRDWHRELDGKIVGLHEPWENSIGKIMFPGDSTADGANVYNCRCTMIVNVMGFSKKLVENDWNELKDLVEPSRPKRSDFENSELLEKAREKYKKEKAVFESKLKDISQRMCPKETITKAELNRWLGKNDVRIYRSLDSVDTRAIKAYTKRFDKLSSDFPEVQNFFKQIGAKFSLSFEDDNSYIAEASGGFNFGAMFKDMEDAMQRINESKVKENGKSYLVYGDNTINSIFDHEFGHNLKFSISHSIKDTSQKVKFEYDIKNTLYGKAGMSEYASANVDELFAEGFSAWYGGEKTEFAQSFGQLLRRWRK